MSFTENGRTTVPAGHKLGKDFVAGRIPILFGLTRHPFRIVTTSVDYSQLKSVLWGEMRHALRTAAIPLDSEYGGPFVVNEMLIRKLWHGQLCDLSYILGRVAEKGEGLSGHHIAKTGDSIPRTGAIVDEASGVAAEVFRKLTEWADTILLIGNPYDCDNMFKWDVEGKRGTEDRGGDVPRLVGRGYERKIVRITAEDSPNVQFARKQIAAGLKPTDEIRIPGVLPFSDYLKCMRDWDEEKKCVGLHAKFYKGASVMMYPAVWLLRSEKRAEELRGQKRFAKAMGIDPGEGGANSAWSIVDELGLMRQLSYKTPDTSDIIGQTIELMDQFDLEPEQVVFDRGGGGKQIADIMRLDGRYVRTVAFGETVTMLRRMGVVTDEEREQHAELRYTYPTRRAQMYGELRELIQRGFALPREYAELHRQLSLIPLKRNREGRMTIPPKTKRDRSSKEITLTEILGCSPDEADSLVLAVHGMLHEEQVVYAGVPE